MAERLAAQRQAGLLGEEEYGNIPNAAKNAIIHGGVKC
jgi:hypothetical protein